MPLPFKGKKQFSGNVDQLESHFAKPAQTVDEDGFEIVGGGNDRKARRQQAAQRQKQDDNDDGFIVRNDKPRANNTFAAMNQ